MIPTKLLDDFYVSILNKLSQFEDIGVIIKSKRLNSFKNLKNAYKLSLNLKERGITYIVEDPFQKNPSLYSNISDLVIVRRFLNVNLSCLFNSLNSNPILFVISP